MSIRIKFFIILLAFSLIPLLVMTVINRQSIIRLGDELAGEARNHQRAAISRDLARSAQVSAEAIRRQVASMELTLRYLADSATHALAQADPPPQTTVYTPGDFQQPGKAPPDVQMSWRYARPTEGGPFCPRPSAPATLSLWCPPAGGRRLTLSFAAWPV